MPSAHILESHQKITDRPSRKIKRSGGQALVRQGRAEWITENVLLRMFPEGTLQISPPSSPKFTAYIPKSMPPAEVEGLHFDDPVKVLQSIRRFHVIVANGIGNSARDLRHA